jgi:hypothetical protein
VTPGIWEYANCNPKKFEGETKTVTGTDLTWSLNFGSGQAMKAASQGRKFTLEVYWLKWKTIADSGRLRTPRARVGRRQFSFLVSALSTCINKGSHPIDNLENAIFPHPANRTKTPKTGGWCSKIVLDQLHPLRRWETLLLVIRIVVRVSYALLEHGQRRQRRS